MPRAPPSSSPPVPPPPPFRDAIRDPLMRRSRVTRLLFLPISIPAEASVPPIASKVRGEFCLAVRQASRGTNRSHSPRGTIEAATFELPDPVGNSGTRGDLDGRAGWHNGGTIETKAVSIRARIGPEIARLGKTAPDGINSARGLGELASSPCNRGRARDKFASILRPCRYEY